VSKTQKLRPIYLLLHHAFPKTSIWPTVIAMGHRKAMWWTEGEKRLREGRSALFWYTRAQELYETKSLKRSMSDTERELFALHRLGSIAHAALAAGQIDLAEKYAREMLRIPDVSLEVWHHRDEEDDARYVYDAHIILGKTALARGDAAGAERQLLEAADAWPIESEDKSYGTDFQLAGALLREGRTATVLDYLRASRRFTAFLDEQIDHWIHEVESGRSPDFTDWSQVSKRRVVRHIAEQLRSLAVALMRRPEKA
jgi:tetratricopeptide (TPR) repeat protein